MSGSVTTSRVLRLVDDIYAAALDENRWKAVLHETCRLVGAEVGSFDWKDLRSGYAAAPCSVGVSPEWEQKYEAHFGRLNPFQQRLLSRADSGDIIDGNELVSLDELRRTEYFNDFLVPMGCSTAGGICLFLTNDFASFLSVLKPLNDRDFTDRQLSVLRTLAPHFQRALTIHQRLRQTAQERHDGLEALEWFPWGLVLLERSGRAWFVNHEARRISSANDGLVLRDDQLQTTPLQHRELQTAIAGACGRHSSEPMGTGAVLTIERPSGMRPYHVTVIPQSDQTLDVIGLPSPGAGALVMISDPESYEEPPIDSLRRFFGFTPAEAALAAAMSRGIALADYAGDAGIATSTARKLLKQLFAKTDTHRQGELVSLLIRTPAGPERNKRV
jgi:DNA-binding CsgD family transcriptional regulator